jgi:Tol biopolymer transport system component
MTLEPAEANLESLSMSFNRAALWIAPADGSEPVKLVDRAAYAFGEPSPASDGSFVVFTRIDNSSDLWENRLEGATYTQALLDEYGPEARIQRYDMSTGELTTLVTNGFRPKVQPRGIDLAGTGGTPTSG